MTCDKYDKNSFDFDAFFKSTMILDFDNVGEQCKETLKELNRYLLSSNTSAEKVRIWIGGMVLAMWKDDERYRFAEGVKRFYPHEDKVKPFLASEFKDKKYMSYIGDELLQRPELFYGALFKRQANYFGRASKGYLFPELSLRVEQIDEMLLKARLLEKKGEVAVTRPFGRRASVQGLFKPTDTKSTDSLAELLQKATSLNSLVSAG